MSSDANLVRHSVGREQDHCTRHFQAQLPGPSNISGMVSMGVDCVFDVSTECLVAFRCKKHGVTIEKVYNKTQRDKFNWAIDMADETFVF